MKVGRALSTLIGVWVLPAAALGQTTSLGKRLANEAPAPTPGREMMEFSGNPTLESRSLIAVRIKPPKKFRVEDLITIIVRQQTTYESDGSIKNTKDLKLQSQLDAFVKFLDGGIGATTFQRGKPNVDYELKMKLNNRADVDREDRLTARVTARIIDVKPNGNLVLEAEAAQRFDEEINIMTLTGTCRSIDVTPDNTVLSTQVAELDLQVKNSGAVRDGSSRGWLHKFIDMTKPF